MRVFAWGFLISTALGLAALFLPAVGLEGPAALGRPTQLSVYQAGTRREVARRAVAAYHRGAKTRLGAAVAATLTPRLAGRVSSYLTDAGDAARTLDTVSDDDVGTIGTALAIGTYVVIALHVVMLGLLVGDTIEASFRRRRIIAALGLAALIAAIGIAVCLAAHVAVDEANAELGVGGFGVGTGAYLAPIGGVGALVAAVGLLVAHVRAGRAAAGAPAPAPS